MAATTAPKAISRISSVMGSEVISAFEKSSVDHLLDLLLGARVAELADGEPRVGGLDRGRPCRGRRPTRSWTSVSSPAIWKRSRAERPSLEMFPRFSGG